MLANKVSNLNLMVAHFRPPMIEFPTIICFDCLWCGLIRELERISVFIHYILAMKHIHQIFIADQHAKKFPCVRLIKYHHVVCNLCFPTEDFVYKGYSS